MGGVSYGSWKGGCPNLSSPDNRDLALANFGHILGAFLIAARELSVGHLAPLSNGQNKPSKNRWTTGYHRKSPNSCGIPFHLVLYSNCKLEESLLVC